MSGQNVSFKNLFIEMEKDVYHGRKKTSKEILQTLCMKKTWRKSSGLCKDYNKPKTK